MGHNLPKLERGKHSASGEVVSKTAHARSALVTCRARVHRLLLLALVSALPFPSSAGEPVAPADLKTATL